MRVDELTPARIGAIVSAFTGILLGDFRELQKYAELVMGRQVYTHEFANKAFEIELKEKSRADFACVNSWCLGE